MIAICDRLAVACALVLAGAGAGHAKDRTFYCFGGEGASENLDVQLTQYDDGERGAVVVGDTTIDAQVFRGQGALMFVVIGDGYALNYTVDLEPGMVHYTGSGKRDGYGWGGCTEAE